MDSISSIIQCNWCLSCFVDPVSLPCGDSMCEKHTDELRVANWVCVLCGEVHKLADGERFPINKRLRSMVEINLAKLDFGPIYKEAKQKVEALESKSAQMKHVIQQPSDYMFTITAKHRNQIDLGREEAMNLVDEVYKEVNLKIIDYHSEAVENIEELSTSMAEWTQSADLKIASWKQSLNELAVNEERWKEITSDADQMNKDFDSRMNATLDPPYNATNLSKRIALDLWIELSKRVQTPDTRDNHSVLVRDVSKIAKAQSWDTIDSELFTVRGFEFEFRVNFEIEDGKMALGAYLYSTSDHEEQSLKVSWTFKVFGKHYQVIAQEDDDYEFICTEIGYGYPSLIFLDDILAHPAFDPQLDFVRVQVEIDEKSVSLKSMPPPIKQSVLICDVSKIAEAQSWDHIDSEIFTAQRGFKFFLRVRFVYSDGEMRLGASLHLQSNAPKQKVSPLLRIRVLGSNDEKIAQDTDSECEVSQDGWSSDGIISLREILADQAYNAKEDSVRVEVIVYENTLEVIDLE